MSSRFDWWLKERGRGGKLISSEITAWLEKLRREQPHRYGWFWSVSQEAVFVEDASAKRLWWTDEDTYSLHSEMVRGGPGRLNGYGNPVDELHVAIRSIAQRFKRDDLADDGLGGGFNA